MSNGFQIDRKYQFTFENKGNEIVFEESGPTPCIAKAKAFDLLEKFLAQNGAYERQGWQLLHTRPYVNGVLFTY